MSGLGDKTGVVKKTRFCNGNFGQYRFHVCITRINRFLRCNRTAQFFVVIHENLLQLVGVHAAVMNCRRCFDSQLFKCEFGGNSALDLIIMAGSQISIVSGATTRSGQKWCRI